MNVLFVGGDQRQIEMIRVLKSKGYNVHVLGYDNLMQAFVEVRKVQRKEIELKNYDIIIFPVSGIMKDGLVKAIFSHTEIKFTVDDFRQMKDDVLVFSGIMTDTLKEFSEETNKKVITLMDMDDVAIFNSIPTAEGIIMMIIENTDYTIHNSDIFILGFGRCGITLARSLTGLGAHITVVVRSAKQYARVFELGYKPLYFSDLKEHIDKADIVVNTVPAVVLDQSVLSHVNISTFIIDMATKPGGVDYEYAKRRGLKATLCPGLPGLVAPKTAGIILAKAIMKQVRDNL